MASQQFDLAANVRTEHGKGASGRLRKTGRVPGIVYGHDVDPTPLDVDALSLYHALHTQAGRNVLVRLDVADQTHLTIVKDLQRHAVRGDVMHVDFQAVSQDQLITAEIPVTLANEDDPRQNGGIVNLVLYTVPIRVRPLEVPQEFVVDLAGTEIGDVRRIGDLVDQVPDGAELEYDEDRTLVTITAPMTEEELEEMVEGAGIEEEEPELVAEGEPVEGVEDVEGEDVEAEGGADAEGDGDADE